MMNWNLNRLWSLKLIIDWSLKWGRMQGNVSSKEMRSQICKLTTHLESEEIREKFAISLRESMNFSGFI